MTPKTTVIILIVLGVLCVVAVAVGVGTGDGGDDGLVRYKDCANWLGAILINDERTRLDLRDIVLLPNDATAMITPSIRIAPGTAQQFKILPSEQALSLRRMPLKLESGPTVHVVWDPIADDDVNQQAQVEFSLKPGTERATQKLMIESPGGTLTLRCAPGNQAAEVRLVE